MSRRELVLIGVIVLLIGVLGGVALASFGGDGDDGSDAAPSTSAPSSTAPSSTAAPSTEPSSTTTTSTTTTTTTTTTTVAPEPVVAVVADLVSGEVMGLPPGTHIDEVEFLMVEVFGAATVDTGWIEGCPLDGEGDNERTLAWDGLQLFFRRETGTPVFDGWTWSPSEPIPIGEMPVDPQPDEWTIELHDGVNGDMTVKQISDQIGIPLDADFAEFGLSVVTGDPGWAYVSVDGPDSAPRDITSRIRFCD